MRTRKDLLQAAGRLMKEGRAPTLEEVAEEAMISRATAYRYFSGVEVLLLEASLDVAAPEAEDLFSGETTIDPVQRLQKADTALHEMIVANEVSLRLMLAHSLEERARGGGESDLPIRQNRRTPLIEAALAPARDEFDPEAYKTLSAALALVIGTEAMVVFRDVLQLDHDEALRIKHWMIRALVEAAERGDTGS